MPTVSYTATAGQTNFAFTFPYISEGHLRLTIDDMPSTDWSLSDSTTLVYSGTTLVGGEVVTIFRETPVDTLLVSFASPSSIRAREVDIAFKQALYAIEEYSLESSLGLRKNFSETAWLGETLPIKNVGEPVDSTDVTTVSWVQNFFTGSGVLPPVTAGDAGKGLIVVDDGTPSFEIKNTQGSVTILRVQDDATSSADARLGKELTGAYVGNSAFVWQFQEQMDMQVEQALGTPEGGAISVSGDTGIIVPAGKYEIVVEGTARSIVVATNSNAPSAACALTSTDGLTVYDESPRVALGMPGGVTGAHDSTAALQCHYLADFAVNTTINLRATCSQAAGDIVLDKAFRVIIREYIR